MTKTNVTFYKNCCPFCESDDLLLMDKGDTGEEPTLFCNKCQKEFPVNSAIKKQVGETREM